MHPAACLSLDVNLDYEGGGFGVHSFTGKGGRFKAVEGASSVAKGYVSIDACEHMAALCLVCETKNYLEGYEPVAAGLSFLIHLTAT